MRASEPSLTRPASRGRQVDVHVDVRGVEHREDLAARREDFTDIGDAVLDASLARRDEGIVEDVDPIEFDVVRGCVERVLRFGNLVRSPHFARQSAAFICWRR